MKYIEEILEKVEKLNPGESEFYDAVKEVLLSNQLLNDFLLLTAKSNSNTKQSLNFFPTSPHEFLQEKGGMLEGYTL